MNQGDATLLAAVIAAVLSLVTLLISAYLAKVSDFRITRRSALTSDFTKLGAKLYEIIALSVKMSQCKTDDSFASARSSADAVAREIDTLRLNTRYPLWGLDSGFRTIKWMPVYIAHMKDRLTEPRAKELLRLGTKLREAMDVAICQAYFRGQQPSIFERTRVNIRAYWLRRFFDTGKFPHDISA